MPKPKDKVLVRLRLDGTLHLVYRGKPLDYRTITVKELRSRAAPKKAAVPKPTANRPATRKPTHSPWRQNCTRMFAETKKKK